MAATLKVPIVLSIFNRPWLTKRVFERIADAAPQRLYVFADGPRRDVRVDLELCADAREVVQNVTWPCNLELQISDRNMGCKARTITGLNWVFEQETEIIFLEDDTLPDCSFFGFCCEMLEKYRHDCRISSVCGSHLVRRTRMANSYFFSMLPSWGRGLWRRSWAGFDGSMAEWPACRDSGLMGNLFSRRTHQVYWTGIMDKAYAGGFDSWAYPYLLACWVQNRLNVVPGESLITNLGFGPEATHTKFDPGYGGLISGTLEFPLRHPPFVIADREYDDRAVEFQVRQGSLVSRVRRKCKSMLRNSIGRDGRVG